MILRRDLFWLGLYGAILAGWVTVWSMDRALAVGAGDAPAEVWAALCAGAAAAQMPALTAMWAIMVAAMMLPTFVPAQRTYLALPLGKHHPSMLACGYAAVWLAAAVPGAAAQSALAELGLVGPDGRSQSAPLTGTLLLLAGLYQLSALKAACLSTCRHPLTWFLGRWRPGRRAAFAMGLRQGAVCIGCCWALMALAFVGGTMNLLWMGAATLLMTVEKLSLGRVLTTPLGMVLIAMSAVTWGAWL